ncbi:hypothetical protein D3C80_2184960 [compost metagenome]
MADEARDGPVHRRPGQGGAELSDHRRHCLRHLPAADAGDYRVFPVWAGGDRGAGLDHHWRRKSQ